MNKKNCRSDGIIDCNVRIKFQFNKKSYEGYKGDTLASALMRNDVRVVGRSFKYHRPRGIFSAGSEEPNALVELRSGSRQEPNTKATVTELYDGLVAKSQNHWPSLHYDFLAINDRISNFLVAGFYYKTFMWPASFWEKIYEPIIRRAAGLGKISFLEDPDLYERGFLHCDILIIGSGPSGLAATITAGRSGARVILIEEDFILGGRLNSESFEINDIPAANWVENVKAELIDMPNVRLMSRTTVVGSYDHGIYTALERVSDHIKIPQKGKARQIFWRIYSKQSILCSGAIERPIAFSNNDRPGIMLASAVRSYVNRWGVVPGRNVVIFTNNDNGHLTAYDLIKKGIKVSAIIDTRPNAHDINGTELIPGAHVINSKGRMGLKEVLVRLPSGKIRQIKCDTLAISGGWNPNIALTCHQNGRPAWSDKLMCFIPGKNLPRGQLCAGAANGDFSTTSALLSGEEKAIKALADIGINIEPSDFFKSEDNLFSLKPFWYTNDGDDRAWVDFQNDVTVKDIKLSIQENFKFADHLKRYTTLGMATDQGKTSNVLGLAIASELTRKSIPETGSLSFRPPYTPVSFGAMGGRYTGINYRPTRKTPSHKWSHERGAVFTEVGNWLRVQWYPQINENQWRQSVDREVLAVRNSVGVSDVSTLGKIDVQGENAGEFLDYIYTNTISKLLIGKCKYGLMLREDGFAYDDGTVARLADDHFIITTTTMNADLVYQNLQFSHQCIWPDLDVQLVPITESWAQFSIAGPNSRNLLKKIVDSDFDISNDAFPFMACNNITICGGLSARLFRISFSGELAYEIAIPPRFADYFIRSLMEVGLEYNLVPYGIEAMDVLRIEKGHVAGSEINGQTTALNLGLVGMLKKEKDFIGNILSKRQGLNEPKSLMLMGFKPLDERVSLAAGSHLVGMNEKISPEMDQGYITSTAFSPNLKHSIGLGFLRNGRNRVGEIIRAINPVQDEDIQVEITSPVFFDSKGDRLYG